MIDLETGEIVETVVEAGAYRRSPQIAELFAAKAKAQTEIENVTKDSSNPHFNSKYASLAAVVDATLGPLANHGISVWQFPSNGEGETIGLTTLLGHASGQWIENVIFVRPAKFDAQSVGSVITYLRRYALMAIAGMAPEDDDDGNAAVAGAGVGRATKATPLAARPAMGANEARAAVKRIRDEIARAGYLEQLNVTALFGPSAADDERLIKAQDGGIAVWNDLLKRHADRRLELATPNSDESPQMTKE